MSRPLLQLNHAALAFALGAAFVVCGVSAHAASTRNYLTVQGRVTNHVGRPVHDAWVFCLGSRRASAKVDTAGWYRLEIPGATLEELQRTTLKIRIQARKTGWRFALSSGAPELGLEMRVVTEEAKLARLRVRSNDSTAVDAVANSVVLDANPRALLMATFVGSEGPQLDAPSVPLDVMQEITLAGSAPSIPELGATEVLTLPMTPGGSSAPAARGATAGTQSAPDPVASSEPVVLGQSRGEGATDTPDPPTTAHKEPTGKAKAVRPAQGGDGQTSSGKPKVVRPALESDAKATTSGSSTTSGVPAPQGSSAPPSSATRSTTGSTTSAMGAAAPRDTSRAVAPSSSSRSRTTGTSGTTPSTAKDPALDEDRSLQRVYSRYDPMVSVGSKPQPAVRPAPEAGGRDVEPGASGSAGEACDCVIRGTVEVQSESPLRGRTEVVIAVEDSPEVSSNVELFMGSPRAFEIRRAPCGVHRLRLYTRSKQRFVLTSVEPRVVCREGSKQQIRLIMEPVARWGISR